MEEVRINISELLSEMNARGVEFCAKGDTLLFRPWDGLIQSDHGRIRRHKRVLLALLRSEGHLRETPPSDPRPRMVCRHCAIYKITDDGIVDGLPIHRDCRHCDRFGDWPSWYEQTIGSRN